MGKQEAEKKSMSRTAIYLFHRSGEWAGGIAQLSERIGANGNVLDAYAEATRTTVLREFGGDAA